MPTLTDTQIIKIEAQRWPTRAMINTLVGALRESRAQEQRYEAALRQIVDAGTTPHPKYTAKYGIKGEPPSPSEIASAALTFIALTLDKPAGKQ